MLKVLHLITRLDYGGAQGNTLYTAGHLDRSRFEVSVIAGPGGILDAKAGPWLRHEPALVREISPLKDLAALLNLRRRIKAASPDVVHTHSSKAGILGRLAAAWAGTPVVIHTFHGFGFHPGQSFLKRWFYILLERVCARFSDALVFVSEDNMRTARAYGIGDPARYRLIRSGVKLASYPAPIDRGARRAQLGLPPDALVVVSIGNAKPQKNPGHFIEAAARLLPARPGARFVFVGGGLELDALKADAARLGLDKVLLFPGWRDDTAELLALADVFAMTSLWEGLPRALVEALRTGLPSVCYAADGVGDILKDGVNGFLIEKNDLDGFCEKLGAVLDDGALRARLAAGAAATDLAGFDIDYMVRQQEDLCEELAKIKGVLKSSN